MVFVEAECIVVGLSAVGGICAKELSKRGVQTTVLEEHFKAGKFHKCSGIMSKKGLESLGVSLAECTLNSVRGARFFAGRQESKVESSREQALVIDRQRYDEQAALEAQEAGAKFEFNSFVTGISQNGGFSVSTAGKKNYFSKIIVGCDGATSAVGRLLGFPKLEQRDFVLAWEGEYSNARFPEKRLVHVYFDQSLFKGFFGWAIPVSEERVRVGFATSDFQAAKKAKKDFLELAQVKQVLGGGCACCERDFNYVIPLKVREKTQIGNALLCGDAAGMVKSTTGGGVVFGGKIAGVAAEEISAHLREGKKLEFEGAWRRRYGRVLRAHYFLRKAYNLMDDSLLRAGVFLSNFGLSSLASRKGDMDFIVS